MSLEDCQARVLTHEIENHIKNDLGQKPNSATYEHSNKVKENDLWE